VLPDGSPAHPVSGDEHCLRKYPKFQHYHRPRSVRWVPKCEVGPAKTLKPLGCQLTALLTGRLGHTNTNYQLDICIKTPVRDCCQLTVVSSLGSRRVWRQHMLPARPQQRCVGGRLDDVGQGHRGRLPQGVESGEPECHSNPALSCPLRAIHICFVYVCFARLRAESQRVFRWPMLI